MDLPGCCQCQAAIPLRVLRKNVRRTAYSEDAIQVRNLVLAGAAALVLAGAHPLDVVTGDQISEGYLAQKIAQSRTQIRPDIVGKGDVPLPAVTLAQTACSIHRTVPRLDDLGRTDGCCPAGEPIATARASETLHRFAASRLG